MKHSPNIVICGNYGATNLGDEAILESILQFVHKAVPGAHVTVVSANPALTASQHHVNVVPKIPSGFRSFFSAFFGKKLKKTLDAYRHADAIIFGGGGLFSDEKPRAIFIWSMQILPALLMKKPVFCFGQSVGPLMMKMSRRMVKFLFRRMKVVIVRDEASRGLLEKIGVRHAEYVPDPVFGLNIGKNSHHSSAGDRDHHVLFSIRPWLRHPEKNYETLARFIDWLYETYHLKTFFVPFQSNQDDDSKEMLAIAARLEHREAAKVLAYNEDLTDVVQLMKKSTAVIGMRLHSLILAAITETPFLGLSYSLKVTEAVRQLGMGNYFCEYRDLDLQTLKKKFELLYTYRSNVVKELAEKRRMLREKTDRYQEILRGLFTQGDRV